MLLSDVVFTNEMGIEYIETAFLYAEEIMKFIVWCKAIFIVALVCVIAYALYKFLNIFF